MSKLLKTSGPSRYDGRGQRIVSSIRTCFPHIIATGIHGNAAWPIRLRELRIDELDFSNLPPAFGALLESLDGRNFTCNGAYISRGDGHPQVHHTPSGICPTCVVSNSLSSGHQSRTSTAAEHWVKEYAVKYMDDEEARPTKGGKISTSFAGSRQWNSALDGGLQMPAEISPIFGLQNTARERLVACELRLRSSLINVQYSLQQEDISTSKRKNMEAFASFVRGELRAAEFARCQLSTAVRSVDAELRIRKALMLPWYATPEEYCPYQVVENQSYQAIRKIEKRYYVERKRVATRRRQPFPDPILPLQIDDTEMFPIDRFITYVQPVSDPKILGVIEGDLSVLLDVNPFEWLVDSVSEEKRRELDRLQLELEQECEWQQWIEPEIVCADPANDGAEDEEEQLQLTGNFYWLSQSYIVLMYSINYRRIKLFTMTSFDQSH